MFVWCAQVGCGPGTGSLHSVFQSCTETFLSLKDYWTCAWMQKLENYPPSGFQWSEYVPSWNTISSSEQSKCLVLENTGLCCPEKTLFSRENSIFCGTPQFTVSLKYVLYLYILLHCTRLRLLTSSERSVYVALLQSPPSAFRSIIWSIIFVKGVQI